MHETPGLTRDRREGDAELYGLNFTVIDTPGLIDPDTTSAAPELAEGMKEQTLAAIRQANVVVFVVDGREGCTPYDTDLANLLRKQKKPLIVVANKCEGKHGYHGIADALALGLGDVTAISAEHGEGLVDLHEMLIAHLPESLKKAMQEEDDEDKAWDRPLHLAIMGRPNVGKSSIINKILGEERQLTADMPGVTRDSITIKWEYEGRQFNLVDTAGIRRQSRVDKRDLEKLAVMDAERTLKYAEVVVLVVDGTVPLSQQFEKQDLSLASDVIKEGRGLIIAVNKWDLVKEKTALLKHLQQELDLHLTQAKGVTCLPISAETGFNLPKLLDEVLRVERTWNKRLTTGELNRWLEYTVTAHPPPISCGRRIRIKYITQIKSRPPTFIAFCSKSADVPDSYRRYLINNLRQDFKLPGIPIRLTFRSSENPYKKK